MSLLTLFLLLFSFSSQHKSIVLHNVSDRLMFSLSRRQQQHAQAAQLGSSLSSTGHSTLSAHSLNSLANTNNPVYATPQPAPAPGSAAQHSASFLQSMQSPVFQSPHSVQPASVASTPIVSYPVLTAQHQPLPARTPQNTSSAQGSGGVLKNNSAPNAGRARSPKSQQGSQSNLNAQRGAPQAQQYPPLQGQHHQGQGQSQGQAQYTPQYQNQAPPQQSYNAPPPQLYQQQQYGQGSAQAQYQSPPPQQLQQQQHQQQQYYNQQQAPQYQQTPPSHQQQYGQQPQRYPTGEEKEYSLNEEVIVFFFCS